MATSLDALEVPMTTIVCPRCRRSGSSAKPVAHGAKVKCPACGESFRCEDPAQPPDRARPDLATTESPPAGSPSATPPPIPARPAPGRPRWARALLPMIPIVAIACAGFGVSLSSDQERTLRPNPLSD